MPFFYLPTCRTGEAQGGRPWAGGPRGTREAGKEGKRERRVRGFDSPPWLGLGWSEEAAPRWPAGGDGYGGGGGAVSRHGVEEATWEREDALKKEFPHRFRSQPNLEDEIPFKWARFVKSQKFTKLNHALKIIFRISFHRGAQIIPKPLFPTEP